MNTTNCAGFLTATPSSGTTYTTGNQNEVVVSVNPHGITPQVCSGNVTLTVPGSTAPPLVIPVTFNVSSSALLNVSQSAISVCRSRRGCHNKDNFGDQYKQHRGRVLRHGVYQSGGFNMARGDAEYRNTPNNLQVIINPANLGVGVYNGSILVSSSALNAPAETIPVTLTMVRPSQWPRPPASRLHKPLAERRRTANPCRLRACQRHDYRRNSHRA